MNKAQFISELSDRLSLLDSDERQRFISYCCEMIDDRIEDGMSEEEAVAAIGSIDEITREVLTEHPAEAAAPEKAAIQPQIITFAEPICRLDVEHKDVGLTIVSGKLPEGETVRIELELAEEPFMHCEVNNGTLILRRVEAEKNGFLDNLFRRFIRFGSFSYTCKVTLAENALLSGSIQGSSGSCRLSVLNFSGDLTAGNGSGCTRISSITAQRAQLQSASGSLWISSVSAEDITAGVSSGSIRANDINCRRLELRASSGAVRAESIKADAFSLSSSSGSVRASCISATTVNVKASSGSVRLADINAQDMSVNTSSGAAALSNAALTGTLTASMSSGTMKLSSVEAAEMSLSSGSGIISGTLCGDPESYSFCANSRSGHISVPNTNGPRRVEVKTGSGIISLSFAN